MKIYCGKCGGAYDDQFVVCPHCGNIREEQQEKFAVEEIKSEPPKSKKKTPKWVKITAVVVAVVIVLTGVLWSTGSLSNIMPVQAGYVRVPSVIGKSREKAKEILTKKKLGLLIIGKMDTDDDMELGLVCEQSPGKGDKAKENADVSVMLSNGPKMGYMPATVYYKVDTATANIEAQGLKAEVKYEYSDDVGKDGVISQSVETNTAVKQGETVTITVSKGSKNESEGTVKMKNLVGMDFETARKELLKDGIYLLVEDAKYDDNAPENQIIVQNDKEGAEIQKGENVFVTISLGKEKVRVPDLVYLEKAEAESKLKELGFTVKTETGSDENIADGLVLEQSAPSGEMLEKGSEITITVNDRPTTAKDGETASSPIDEYVRILEQYQEPVDEIGNEKYYPKYTVYDIDKDGIYELIIDTSIIEAERAYKIYTIKNVEAVLLGDIPGSHVALYGKDGENGMLSYWAHQGVEAIVKISIKDGNIVSESISSREVGADGNYTKLDNYLEEVETIDYSLLYDVMGDKGTDKALSKEEVKELFIKANDLYVGWINGKKTCDIKDFNDTIQVDDRGFRFVRLNAKEFSTIEGLDELLNQSFFRYVYKDDLDRDYITRNGKIYVNELSGEGGDWYPSKYKLTIISSNNSQCKFTIEELLTDEDAQSNADFLETDSYLLYKFNGKWLFAEEENRGYLFFAELNGIYENEEKIQWVLN